MTPEEEVIWKMLRATPDHVYVSSDKRTLYLGLSGGLIKLSKPYGRATFDGMDLDDLKKFVKHAIEEASH